MLQINLNNARFYLAAAILPISTLGFAQIDEQSVELTVNPSDLSAGNLSLSGEIAKQLYDYLTEAGLTVEIFREIRDSQQRSILCKNFLSNYSCSGSAIEEPLYGEQARQLFEQLPDHLDAIEYGELVVAGKDFLCTRKMVPEGIDYHCLMQIRDGELRQFEPAIFGVLN